jgi:hypothetical protein
MIPHEIELPEIPMQIFAANVVIDADQAATDKGMAALRSVHVNVAYVATVRIPLSRGTRYHAILSSPF